MMLLFFQRYKHSLPPIDAYVSVKHLHVHVTIMDYWITNTTAGQLRSAGGMNPLWAGVWQSLEAAVYDSNLKVWISSTHLCSWQYSLNNIGRPASDNSLIMLVAIETIVLNNNSGYIIVVILGRHWDGQW